MNQMVCMFYYILIWHSLNWSICVKISNCYCTCMKLRSELYNHMCAAHQRQSALVCLKRMYDAEFCCKSTQTWPEGCCFFVSPLAFLIESREGSFRQMANHFGPGNSHRVEKISFLSFGGQQYWTFSGTSQT